MFLFVHMFLGKTKTNDLTQRIIPLTFCSHVTCCKEYRICPAKNRVISIENAIYRDGLFKLHRKK